MDPNYSESDDEYFAPCQTPQESQTRSTDYLKKPSMNQHAQKISATTSQRAQQSTQKISVTSELDLPPSGSEDDDETWLTELIGSEAVSQIAVEEFAQMEEYLMDINLSRISTSVTGYQPVSSYVTNGVVTQSVAELDLPLTPLSSDTNECHLPRPMFRDGDEDSLPLTQVLDLVEHIACSTHDMTTSVHESNSLTHSGFQMATLVGQIQLSGSTESCQAPTKNAL